MNLRSKSKIAAILMAVVLVSMSLASCAGGNTLSVNVAIVLGDDYINYMYALNEDDEEYMIPEDDRTMLNYVTIEVSYDDGEQVSVLDAFIEACANYDISYELDSSGQSVSSIESYGKVSYTDSENSDNNVTYFWTYTINGVEPTSGRAGTNYVSDGDKIVFTLTGAAASDYDEE